MATNRRYSKEEITEFLRKAELGLSQGQTVAQVCCLLGVCRETFYRWRQAYSNLNPDYLDRLKALEEENACLKQQVKNLISMIPILVSAY